MRNVLIIGMHINVATDKRSPLTCITFSHGRVRLRLIHTNEIKFIIHLLARDVGSPTGKLGNGLEVGG